jgi:hypothetical protein
MLHVPDVINFCMHALQPPVAFKAFNDEMFLDEVIARSSLSWVILGS